MRALSSRPAEALQDELAASVRKLDGRALGLPAIGFFHAWPGWEEHPAAPEETNAERALFVLCHRYGDVFARDADPIPQLFGGPIDLIAPTGTFER
jgi:hypothetical protein